MGFDYDIKWYMGSNRPPDKSEYWKTISLFLIQNICCWYSKEQSFEHPKRMFKLIGKKIIAILH